jgi:hypothetical protein
VDQPFSVAALVNTDTAATARQILTKFDRTTGSTKREWDMSLSGSGQPQVVLRDESAGSYIGRSDATALTVGAWTLLTATYDGSRSLAGIRLYRDAVRADDTDQSSGTYTAMENTGSLLRVGFRQGTSAGEEYFDGKMALWAITGRELSREEVWALKEAVIGYYGLEL